MGNFICSKCRTCSKFPFCTVIESKDGNCGEYIKRNIYEFIDNRLKEIDHKNYLNSLRGDGYNEKN